MNTEPCEWCAQHQPRPGALIPAGHVPCNECGAYTHLKDPVAAQKQYETLRAIWLAEE